MEFNRLHQCVFYLFLCIWSVCTILFIFLLLYQRKQSKDKTIIIKSPRDRETHEYMAVLFSMLRLVWLLCAHVYFSFISFLNSTIFSISIYIGFSFALFVSILFHLIHFPAPMRCMFNARLHKLHRKPICNAH